MALLKENVGSVNWLKLCPEYLSALTPFDLRVELEARSVEAKRLNNPPYICCTL